MNLRLLRAIATSALAGCVLSLLVCCSLAAPSALAAEPAAQPWWRLETVPAPTVLKSGRPGQVIEVIASNLGTATEAEADGSPAAITIDDKLPAGLRAVAIKGGSSESFRPFPVAHCTLVPLACEWTLAVPAFSSLTIDITVEVETPSDVSSVTNEAEVKGGIAPAVSSSSAIEVADGEPGFGIQNYELLPENADGSPDLQSGSHPFQLTTALDFNQTPEKTVAISATNERLLHTSPALPKDISVKLPPGLVANATAVKQCSAADFTTIVAFGNVNGCPADTAIGVATVQVSEPRSLGFVILTVPVFNLVPGPGEPARFGFEATQDPVVLDTALEAGGDYHAVVSVKNASQAVNILGSQLTIWGAPADRLHDSSRGWGCLAGGFYQNAPEGCRPLGVAEPPAFLTLPTECSRLSSTVSVDSWSQPGSSQADGTPTPGDPRWRTFPAEGAPPTGGLLNDCAALPFGPATAVAPDSAAASTPTGLSVKIDVPQQATLSDAALAEADVKDTVVALPPGIQASPGAANGLETCTVAQSGFAGLDSDLGEALEGELAAQRFTPEPVSCPDGAKIGSVEIFTPLLESHLTGSVYLAAQDTNPFGTPLVLYLIAEDPAAGVRVKLAGDVAIDQTTGQLVSTFRKTPPLPFSELELHLFDGARASQSTPALCGSYETSILLAPSSGNPAVPTSSSFSISEGAGGGPCETTEPQPFSPTFQAGPASSQAGAFAPFTLTIGHADGDQPLSGIATKLPQGAAAMIASLTPCPEPPAGGTWSCAADSLIGHASSSSGFGAAPVTLGGEVYLTSGYDGAPFGLLVSTNAEHVGPFNLGVIDVRSRIDVDPSTAAVTVTTDPGPHGDGFPTRLKGVPVDLKQITVTIDRERFEFNPTNCSQQSVMGTLEGVQGAMVPVSAPYPVTGCASLPFRPTFAAFTQGNASKANGASLTVRVSSSPGQANIAKTKLVLPLALPSRLTTIQKACPDSVFAANPAACDEGSNIGTATVHTPVLKSALNGPAYLVSHGNAAFPDVEFVLQGEGITLILDGQTDIKKGITTSTFNAVPDAPVSTFEAVLPEGPHSALTSNVAASKRFSLCGAKLVMPVTITGQNGAVIQQDTKVPVAGCSAVEGFKVTRAQRLDRALKACRKQFKHSRHKRVACEAKARKRLAAKKPQKRSGAKRK